MAMSYNKLWKILIDKAIGKTDFRNASNISAATMFKLRHGDVVTTETIEKICNYLNCQPGDIMEFVPDIKAGE